MNYSPFLNSGLNRKLNKNIKFKNKNRYIAPTNRKNSRLFLLTAVVSVAMIGMAATLLANSDSTETLPQTFSSRDTSSTLSATTDNSSKGQKTTDLELPVISYTSEPVKTVEGSIYAEGSLHEKTKVNAIIAKAAELNIITDITPVKSNQTNTINAVTNKAIEKKSATPAPTESVDLVTTKTAKSSTVQSDNHSISKRLTKNLLKDTLKAVKNPEPQAEKTAARSDYSKTITVKVKKGDTLSAIFKRHNLSSSSLYKIINSGKEAKRLTRIKPGQTFSIALNQKNKITRLEFQINKIDTLLISRNDRGYTPEIQSKDIETRQQFTAGIITNSLFAAGQKAGLNSAMIMKLAHIFGWDVDFALDIRKGDSFAVLYEEQYVDGNKIASGNILSAEFVNQGKVFRAIRYTDASDHTDYYSEKGLSMRKAFLRTPVAFSRISSRFSTGRKHPVLNRIRAHKGVDYAASRGTPIKAVGDGKVIFKGRKGGYGRVIILQHGSKYTTLYAHMNAYNKKLHNGSRVKQGQTIGYVGMSGLATGPHLHYEFRINGVHRNPLTVKLPSAAPISKKYRADFKVAAETMISQLKLRKQETIALNSH